MEILAEIGGDSTLLDDVRCVCCGYNLRGLHQNGACPECATPIGRSIRGDFLRFAEPEWVRRVAVGVLMLAVALIVALLLGCLGAAVSLLSMSRGVYLQMVISWFASFMTWVGTWLMTARDPSGFGEDLQRNSRRLIRAIAMAHCVIVVTGNIVSYSTAGAPGFVLLVAFMVLAMSILELVGDWLRFGYFGYLARRVPDVKLAARVEVLRWWFVLSKAVGAISTMIMVLQWALSSGFVSPFSPTSDSLLQFLRTVSGISAFVFGMVTTIVLLRLWTEISHQARLAAAPWEQREAEAVQAAIG